MWEAQLNAPYAPITTVFDQDWQDEAPGYAARQAEQHLRSMSAERRAFLEREWTEEAVKGIYHV